MSRRRLEAAPSPDDEPRPLHEHDAELAEARRELDRLRGEEARLHAELEELRADRRAALDVELLSLTRQVAEANARSEAAERAAARDRAAAAAAGRALARVDGSVTWRAFQRVRAVVYGPRGSRSLRGRAISAILRAAGGISQGGPPAPDAGPEAVAPIRVPLFERPYASVIVPTHSNAELAERCLRRLVGVTAGVPYELIVVNDAGDSDTRRLVDALENATVVANSDNLRFLRSVNRAAEHARSRYLVLLNDDTEVEEGWLEALVDCADSDPAIAYVASKLTYPDGRLQEAGAIVWSDGTGWNFGRGDDPSLAQYDYRRDIDYGSAAAVLVRADAWAEVGGFDERFAPSYYEDTDLCFALRARGHRVVYEPRARVVHHERATSAKENQELNRPKFVQKWRDVLEAGHRAPPPASDPRVAADRGHRLHALVIDADVPRYDRDSGSLRMFELLRGLRDSGSRVTFLPDTLAAAEPYAGRLQSLGVEVLRGPLDLRSELQRLGRTVGLVVASRPQVAARYLDALREHMPDALLVYDTVDLQHVREGRAEELGVGRPPKAEALRELELALIRSYDLTVTITEQESERVLAEVPDAGVVVIPNANEPRVTAPGPDGREGVVFVGGFQHPPNFDAVVELVHHIMPLVWRELPGCRLTIVGPEARAELEALASERVHVAGWVEDLDPVLDGARAMVAPLRYGSGMKGKITQSLAAGLPVVTSTVGAEGLAATGGEQLLVADDPEEFAAAVVRLYGDDELWRRLSAAGIRLAAEGWSRDVMRARVGELVDMAEHWPARAAS